MSDALTAMLEERQQISLKKRLRWLRNVSNLVHQRYNGASRPLNAKATINGIQYPTVYAVSTARLGDDQLPFTLGVPNQFVAKYVPNDFFGEKEARFSSELSSTIGLRVYSTTTLEQSVELAFEKAEGSLDDVLDVREISEESTEDFAAIAYHIAGVLYELEEKRIVHGDIKPGNIFCLQEQEITKFKLGDFEWAFTYKDYQRVMKEYDVLFGTLGFYPPEFLTLERTTIRNPVTHDMFSYGSTLYALLFNQIPGEQILDSNDERRNEEIYNLHLIRGLHYAEMRRVINDVEIIPELRRVILRATHPRPQRRYQSFADVMRELEQYK